MKNLYLEQIEHEVTMLLRRADFKRTLDGGANTIDRSAYLILKLLDREGSSAISAISDTFQLDVSTVSRQIAALESKGFVRRNSDSGDARVSLVEITESGQQALHTAINSRLEAYTEILDGWTEDELQIFSKLLTRFNRSIEARKRLR